MRPYILAIYALCMCSCPGLCHGKHRSLLDNLHAMHSLKRSGNTITSDDSRKCKASCGGYSYIDNATKDSDAVRPIYFKGVKQIYWMDENFNPGGPVLGYPAWLSRVKNNLAPPFHWKTQSCNGTVCPEGAPHCHHACFSKMCCGCPGRSACKPEGTGAQVWTKLIICARHIVP